MANINQVSNSVNHKYKDLGDGTFAEVVSLDGGVTISSVTVSDVEISNDIGNPIPITLVSRTCVGHQTLSVTTGTATALTIPVGSISAVIQADGGAISLRLDGVAPTTSSGIRVDDGGLYYVDTALASVQVIARTATTAVQVAYFNKA